MFVNLEDAVAQAQRERKKPKLDEVNETKKSETKLARVAPVAHSPAQKTMQIITKKTNKAKDFDTQITQSGVDVTASTTAQGVGEVLWDKMIGVKEQKSQDSMDKTQ